MKASLDDLNHDQRLRIEAFAREHGRNWKSKLNDMWCNGQDAYQWGGSLLRQVRNEKGPSWLDALVL